MTELISNAFIQIMVLSLPFLIAGLVIGLVVGIFQAITQIHDATISFIPKLILLVLLVVIGLPWFMDMISDYTHFLYRNVTLSTG